MSPVLTYTALLTVLMIVQPAVAGPLNDNFANATVITVVPFSDSIDVTTATSDGGDPAICGNTSQNTVWYKYTATADNTLVIDTFGSTYDTLLAIYTGTAGALTELKCNDDASFGTLTSQVSYNVTNGETYYFMISTYPGENAGALSFHAAIYPPPPNDQYSAAIIINTVPYTAPAIANLDATAEVTDPAPSCAQGGKTLWFRFLAANNGILTVDTLGSTYDTILSAYTGVPGSFSELNCNDDIDADTRQSRISFSATAGVTYSIMVSAFVNNEGVLRVHLDGPPQGRKVRPQITSE